MGARRDAKEEEKAGCRDGSAAQGSESGISAGGDASDSRQAQETGEAQKRLDRGSDGVGFRFGKSWGTPPPFLAKSEEVIEDRELVFRAFERE